LGSAGHSGRPCLDRSRNRVHCLIDDASALSQRVAGLPRYIRGRSGAAAIEHAERKHSVRHINESLLQIVAGAESRFQGVAEFVFSGFRNVVE